MAWRVACHSRLRICKRTAKSVVVGYLDRLAERFGFSAESAQPEDAEAVQIDRRKFLKSLAAAGLVVAAPSGLFVPAERRIFQVPGVGIPILRPVHGHQGLYKITPSGEIFNIRDFRESDRYDSVVFLPGEITVGTEFTFFNDVQGSLS